VVDAHIGSLEHLYVGGSWGHTLVLLRSLLLVRYSSLSLRYYAPSLSPLCVCTLAHTLPHCVCTTVLPLLSVQSIAYRA